jgi:hypothetical protein
MWPESFEKDYVRLEATIKANEEYFTKTPDGYIFGTVAVRTHEGFLTTARGKRELDKYAWVRKVDHINREVHVERSPKATLNAPLLDNIFKCVPKAKTVIHYHERYKGLPKGLPVLPWAPAGTVRDSDRDVKGSFNIDRHGCFLLLDEDCGIIR